MPEKKELSFASPETVNGRRWTSDIFAVFNEIMLQAGVHDCETRQAYMTLIDLARRAEEQAERLHLQPSEHRRFHAPNWSAELFHRRETLPPKLSKEEFKKRSATLARSWRRRWLLIHESQCRSQLAFFIKEDGNLLRRNREVKRQPSAYTDHLSDLIIKAIKRSRDFRGHSVLKIRRAVTETLNEFRHTTDWYAPKWTLPEGELTVEEQDFWQNAENRIKRFTNNLLREAEAKGESTDAVRELMSMVVKGKASSYQTRKGVSPLVTLDENTEQNEENEVFSRDKFVRIETPSDEPVAARDESPPEIHVRYSSNSSSIALPVLSNADMYSEDVAKFDEADMSLTAFESVGCSRFKVVHLSLKPLDGQTELVGSSDSSLADLREKLPDLIARSEGARESIAVRPLNGSLIQVDDCTGAVMESLKPYAFLTVETSPENYQVWFALHPLTSNDTRLALRDRLLSKLKGSGANGGAYNSMRLPGTLNAKEKYLIGDRLPCVMIHEMNAGRQTSLEELNLAELLAEEKSLEKPKTYTNNKLPSGWPDYYHYLNQAPLVDGQHPDRSNADIRWAMVALSWGWPISSVAQELENLSSKAKKRRDKYGMKTAEAAAGFLAEGGSHGFTRIESSV